MALQSYQNLREESVKTLHAIRKSFMLASVLILDVNTAQ